MQDVARLAGVSPMTVSRVLSRRGNVRADLRARVEKAIAESGYRRNENARSLRPGHRSGLIGVTITNIANPYYAEMQLGIEEVAAQRSRRILVGNSHEDPDVESQLVADFLGRQVEGLIVVPATTGDVPHLHAQQLSGVPLALASRAVAGLDVDTVLVDDVGGSIAAVADLIREGHRRIGFLGTSLSIFTGARRMRGYREAHALHGLDVDERLIRVGHQDVAAAETAMVELLTSADPPTAVFTANNRNTLGAMRAMRRQGPLWEAHRQVRIHGFDSLEIADFSPVRLSLVTHDPRELGRQVARMLTERLDGVDARDRPGSTIELPVELRDVTGHENAVQR